MVKTPQAFQESRNRRRAILILDTAGEWSRLQNAIVVQLEGIVGRRCRAAQELLDFRIPKKTNAAARSP